MAERTAVNASPLIFLGKAGLLELLRVEAPEVVVPEPVWIEVTAAGAPDAIGATLASLPWLRRSVPVTVPPSVEAWDLGSGESAVIAWAMASPGTSVVLDDLAARRCALAYSLEVTGTLGLVLRGHTRGIVRDPRAAIDQLRASGMWLSDRVVESALGLVGGRGVSDSSGGPAR